MKNLASEVVTFIQGLTLIYTVDVRESYSKKPPTYPMIVVGEIQNATLQALIGEERYATLGYQIDIFSKDMMVSGTPTSGVKVCRELAETLDSELQEQYGISRESTAELPDVNDETVSRITIRYTGTIDSKTDIMYR